MIEISSHLIEHNELGQMHFTRFTPPFPSQDEIGVYFGGINSRSSTIDMAGVAQIIAAERGIVVDVIDRPGNGLSTLPEDVELRRDYRRYGFAAVSEAVIDMQQSDALFRQAKRIRGAGMSLGGQIVMQYLDKIGSRARGADLIDSAGLRLQAPKVDAVGRYFGYLVVEMAATKLGKKPSVDEVYESDSEILAAHNEFLARYPATVIQPAEARINEFRELCRLADGTGIDLAVKVMQTAVDEDRPFELRASRSGARKFSDKGSVEVMNRKFHEFDARNGQDHQVTYGFLQDNTHIWHELAVAPSAVRKLISSPMSTLQRQMR